MDEKEITASDFIPKGLLEIICILERWKKNHSYNIIHNRSHFSLIAFPARNGELTPLKNNASIQQTASHQEKKRVSSEDKLSSRKRKRGRKNLCHMLLELNLQVNVRKRNLTFLPMSG